MYRIMKQLVKSDKIIFICTNLPLVGTIVWEVEL